MRRFAHSRIDRWTTARLIRVALAHGTASRGWDAVAALHRRGSQEILARAEALFRSASVRRRALALDIVAQLREPHRRGPDPAAPFGIEAAQAMLVAALDDRDGGVLQSAIAGLGHCPVPGLLPRLIAFEAHHDSRVRWALVHTLDSYREPESVAALMRLAADRDDEVRDWATFSIGTLSEADDDAVRALLWKNAFDSCRDVRGEALVGLARRSDPRIIELLKERLLDDDCRVYELEAAEEMPRAELLDTLLRLRDDAERLHDLDPTWHRHLLDAIDACELVADATS